MLTMKRILELTKDKEVCYNCKFYQTETLKTVDEEVVFTKQECRKSPPRMGQNLYATFPKVDILCWCGAFERKEASNG